MSEEPRRRRAPAMSPEDRREAIVQATLPLVVKAGANVTTSQIAAAAGIAEGTVFRVFKDKAELLDAVIQRALLSDEEVARIKAVPANLSIEKRLVEATSTVSGYLDRMWSVMGALRESGYQPSQEDHEKHKGPQAGMQRVSNAIAELFSDADLRTSPEHAARLLLGFVFTNRLQGKGFGETTVDPEQLVELFLHGALKPGGAND
ncbi:TetR family transcriptional regulator [Lentzea sp. NBC_00516]|uniref:TetR family transcriptional regulator n=1 Tax=Lentzea sokolovensis TaxID=3095429 RepID=A0ABU4VDF6_9PSEU|nr:MULTISPECIES: TetR family transcriptional regulator [unclassified Lentzea]MDX8149800.1 TetR family transcriptional regulator [Lentzea sp. BCCO 10_0061]WUD21281.1 TetR family transcriptional regulator [Lentzea sp. NBC_00516]